MVLSMHACHQWKEGGFSRRRLTCDSLHASLFGTIFHLFHVKLAQRLLIRSVVRIGFPFPLLSLLSFSHSSCLSFSASTNITLLFPLILPSFFSFNLGQAGVQAPRIYSLGFSVHISYCNLVTPSQGTPVVHLSFFSLSSLPLPLPSPSLQLYSFPTHALSTFTPLHDRFRCQDPLSRVGGERHARCTVKARGMRAQVALPVSFFL